MIQVYWEPMCRMHSKCKTDENVYTTAEPEFGHIKEEQLSLFKPYMD